MGVTNSNKLINVDRINCDGTFKVTLALTAAPNITENPTDIVLVLDRSGSMSGSPLANLKLGANKFIDIIDESTDGSQDGQIGSGSRIGIVSFADNATADTQLITSVADLKSAVDALTAGGFTNHADAFTAAGQLFDPNSSNAKVLIMFTDGKTTTGSPPAPVAASLRSSGVIIYCIGLIGSDGIDVDTLNDWATDPDASHVAVTPDDSELEDLFADLAENISKPGATNIIIDEIINSDFTITSLSSPTKGTASLINSRTIKWSIDSLGTTTSEGASLEFDVRHTSSSSGVKYVNQSISYSDTENNVVTFPNPTITVDCCDVVYPEKCPEVINLTMSGCQETMVVDLGDNYMESLGRILQLNTTVKNVCPGKRVALGVILSEVDQYGIESPRGLKAITIPAHNYSTCRDVEVRGIKFVLPEDLNATCSSSSSMCGARNFRVRLISHHIDHDFQCCDSDSTCVQ